VGFFDATNISRGRRVRIRKRSALAGCETIFIELINDDVSAIDENVRAAKLSSPDYEGVDDDEAVRDFHRRIAHYQRGYQTVADDEGSYVKLIDRHRKIITNRIDGWIPARLIAFLTNLQITEKPVLIARHGESTFNEAGRIGGDAPLSLRGREFSRSLAAFVEQRFSGRELRVWTSRLRRAVETAAALGREVREWTALAEIDAGTCDGLTYEEIRRLHPDEFAARARDKLRYRYPRGESYLDVIQRLDRVIIEVERQRVPVLIIGHQAVLRALYSYFTDVDPEQIPYVEIPLHTVIELTPRAYDCAELRVVLPPG
jgi:broad specificity phosphatase PhoE